MSTTSHEQRQAKEKALEARWAEIGPRIVRVMSYEGWVQEPLFEGWTVERNGYFFRCNTINDVSIAVKPPQANAYSGRRAGAVTASLCLGTNSVKEISTSRPESPTCHADAARDPEVMVREFVKKLTPHAHVLADWVARQKAAASALTSGAEQALTAMRSAGLVVSREYGEAADSHRLTVNVTTPGKFPGPGGYVRECYVEGLVDGPDRWAGTLDLRSVPFDRMVEILKIVTAP